MKTILSLLILLGLFGITTPSASAATTPEQDKAIQLLREAAPKAGCPRCHHRGNHFKATGRCDCPECMVCNPAAAPVTKEGKLAALTNRYRAGKIAPRVYHDERTKILGE